MADDIAPERAKEIYDSMPPEQKEAVKAMIAQGHKGRFAVKSVLGQDYARGEQAAADKAAPSGLGEKIGAGLVGLGNFGGMYDKETGEGGGVMPAAVAGLKKIGILGGGEGQTYAELRHEAARDVGAMGVRNPWSTAAGEAVQALVPLKVAPARLAKAAAAGKGAAVASQVGPLALRLRQAAAIAKEGAQMGAGMGAIQGAAKADTMAEVPGYVGVEAAKGAGVGAAVGALPAAAAAITPRLAGTAIGKGFGQRAGQALSDDVGALRTEAADALMRAGENADTLRVLTPMAGVGGSINNPAILREAERFPGGVPALAQKFRDTNISKGITTGGGIFRRATNLQESSGKQIGAMIQQATDNGGMVESAELAARLRSEAARAIDEAGGMAGVDPIADQHAAHLEGLADAITRGAPSGKIPVARVKQLSVGVGEQAQQAYRARAAGNPVAGTGRALMDTRRQYEDTIGDEIERLGIGKGAYKEAKSVNQAARIAAEAGAVSQGRSLKNNPLSLGATMLAAGGNPIAAIGYQVVKPLQASIRATAAEKVRDLGMRLRPKGGAAPPGGSPGSPGGSPVSGGGGIPPGKLDGVRNSLRAGSTPEQVAKEAGVPVEAVESLTPEVTRILRSERADPDVPAPVAADASTVRAPEPEGRLPAGVMSMADYHAQPKTIVPGSEPTVGVRGRPVVTNPAVRDLAAQQQAVTAGGVPNPAQVDQPPTRIMPAQQMLERQKASASPFTRVMSAQALEKQRKASEVGMDNGVPAWVTEDAPGGAPDKTDTWYRREMGEDIESPSLQREKRRIELGERKADALPKNPLDTLRAILDENGIGDHDSAQADAAFAQWVAGGRQGPKPQSKLGGILDAFNASKDRRGVSSVLEGFIKETRGAKTWAEIERHLPVLAEALGVERLRLPGDAMERSFAKQAAAPAPINIRPKPRAAAREEVEQAKTAAALKERAQAFLDLAKERRAKADEARKAGRLEDAAAWERKAAEAEARATLPGDANSKQAAAPAPINIRPKPQMQRYDVEGMPIDEEMASNLARHRAQPAPARLTGSQKTEPSARGKAPRRIWEDDIEPAKTRADAVRQIGTLSDADALDIVAWNDPEAAQYVRSGEVTPSDARRMLLDIWEENRPVQPMTVTPKKVAPKAAPVEIPKGYDGDPKLVALIRKHARTQAEAEAIASASDYFGASEAVALRALQTMPKR